MNKIKPLNDLVVIKVIEDEIEKTESGILLPGLATKNKNVLKGTIVAFGPGTAEVEMKDISEGDTILVPSRAVTNVEIEKEMYAVVVYRNLMCKLD